MAGAGLPHGRQYDKGFTQFDKLACEKELQTKSPLNLLIERVQHHSKQHGSIVCQTRENPETGSMYPIFTEDHK